MIVTIERNPVTNKFNVVMEVQTAWLVKDRKPHIELESTCRRYEQEAGKEWETDDIVEALTKADNVMQAWENAKEIMHACFTEERGLELGVKMFDSMTFEEPEHEMMF